MSSLFRTGIARLDRVCLGGGVPAGFLEVSGKEASGKTAVLASIVRENSGPSVWISLSGVPEKRWITTCGAGDAVAVLPNSSEAAIDAAYLAIKGGAKIVVIDTLSQLEPTASMRRMVDGDAGGRGRWRLVYHSLSRLRLAAGAHRALVVFSNELRMQIGRRMMPTFHRLTHQFARTSIRVRRIAMRSAWDEFAYLHVGVSVDKSGLVPPGGSDSFLITKESGVDREMALLSAMVDSGVVTSRGTWWYYEEHRLGPGYSAACATIAADYAYWRRVYAEESNR